MAKPAPPPRRRNSGENHRKNWFTIVFGFEADIFIPKIKAQGMAKSPRWGGERIIAIDGRSDRLSEKN